MVEKKQSNKESIFKTLVQVDVSKHTYDKPANRSKTIWLTYLNWAWAYSYLMFFDKDATYHFKQYPEYDFQAHQCTGRKVDYMNTTNGAYVTAVIKIKGKTKQQSLPVMDAKNNAVMNPDVTLINKAKQRAFVKCLALFGLGLSLYMDDRNKKSTNHKGGGKSGSSKDYDDNGEGMKGRASTKGQHNFINKLEKQVVGHLHTQREKNAYNYVAKSNLAKLDMYTCSKIIDVLKNVDTSKPESRPEPKNSSDNSPRRKSDSIGSTGDVKQGSLI